MESDSLLFCLNERSKNMQSIWKYELEIADYQEIMIPSGADIISVGNQRGILCLWARVDHSKEKKSRRIMIVGTGQGHDNLPMERFIGTVIVEPYVWHVFDGVK